VEQQGKDGDMVMTHTLDTIASGAQDVQFAQLEKRLVDDYGAALRDTVRSMVEQERERFSDSRVHAFVPILVERSVRLRLGSPR
jgi:hypothetical protein